MKPIVARHGESAWNRKGISGAAGQPVNRVRATTDMALYQALAGVCVRYI